MAHYAALLKILKKNITCQKQHLKFNNLKIKSGCSIMTHVWEEVLPSSSKDKFLEI